MIKTPIQDSSLRVSSIYLLEHLFDSCLSLPLQYWGLAFRIQHTAVTKTSAKGFDLHFTPRWWRALSKALHASSLHAKSSDIGQCMAHWTGLPKTHTHTYIYIVIIIYLYIYYATVLETGCREAVVPKVHQLASNGGSTSVQVAWASELKHTT